MMSSVTLSHTSQPSLASSLRFDGNCEGITADGNGDALEKAEMEKNNEKNNATYEDNSYRLMKDGTAGVTTKVLTDRFSWW